MAEATLTFPPDFLWGTATSSYQVEGWNTISDWWAWEQEEGHIAGNGRSGLACDWWQNAEADLALAAELGTNAIRLSLEWSRIEPEPSVFDEHALARYREILQACHDLGLRPMVTLHHFSNPHWLSEKGDFSAGIVVDYFRRYTAKVVATLGDLVPLWVTFNEPVYYAYQRYLAGAFPQPGATGWSAMLRAVRNMLASHAAAYHTIKQATPEALVGGAHYMADIAPIPKANKLDKWWAGRLATWLNDAWPDSLGTGTIRTPLGRMGVSNLSGTADFVGINYYGRYYVKFPPSSEMLEREAGSEDRAYERGFGDIYPYGLYQAIHRVQKRHDLPIYITSNGLPDREDAYRPGYILDHLRQVWHAISYCYPVMGYFHWSLIDNFAWQYGWERRFGLVALDEETQTRTWRRSAHLYRAICQSSTLSSEMAREFAPEMAGTLFPGGPPPAVPSEPPQRV